MTTSAIGGLGFVGLAVSRAMQHVLPHMAHHGEGYTKAFMHEVVAQLEGIGLERPGKLMGGMHVTTGSQVVAAATQILQDAGSTITR